MNYKRISSIIVSRNIKRGNHLEDILKRLLPDWGHRVKVPLNETKNHIVDIVTHGFFFEIKHGYNFDTKKAAKEVEVLTSLNEHVYPDKTPVIVLFTAQTDKDLKMFKVKDKKDVIVVNGRQFCEEFTDVSYEEIIEEIAQGDLETIKNLIDELKNQCLI